MSVDYDLSACCCGVVLGDCEGTDPDDHLLSCFGSTLPRTLYATVKYYDFAVTTLLATVTVTLSYKTYSRWLGAFCTVSPVSGWIGCTNSSFPGSITWNYTKVSFFCCGVGEGTNPLAIDLAWPGGTNVEATVTDTCGDTDNIVIWQDGPVINLVCSPLQAKQSFTFVDDPGGAANNYFVTVEITE